MFSGRGLQGDLMKVLCLGKISVIKVPEDGGTRIAVGQFGG